MSVIQKLSLFTPSLLMPSTRLDIIALEITRTLRYQFVRRLATLLAEVDQSIQRTLASQRTATQLAKPIKPTPNTRILATRCLSDSILESMRRLASSPLGAKIKYTQSQRTLGNEDASPRLTFAKGYDSLCDGLTLKIHESLSAATNPL